MAKQITIVIAPQIPCVSALIEQRDILPGLKSGASKSADLVLEIVLSTGLAANQTYCPFCKG